MPLTCPSVLAADDPRAWTRAVECGRMRTARRALRGRGGVTHPRGPTRRIGGRSWTEGGILRRAAVAACVARRRASRRGRRSACSSSRGPTTSGSSTTSRSRRTTSSGTRRCWCSRSTWLGVLPGAPPRRVAARVPAAVRRPRPRLRAPRRVGRPRPDLAGHPRHPVRRSRSALAPTRLLIPVALVLLAIGPVREAIAARAEPRPRGRASCRVRWAGRRRGGARSAAALTSRLQPDRRRRSTTWP